MERKVQRWDFLVVSLYFVDKAGLFEQNNQKIVWTIVSKYFCIRVERNEILFCHGLNQFARFPVLQLGLNLFGALLVNVNMLLSIENGNVGAVRAAGSVFCVLLGRLYVTKCQKCVLVREPGRAFGWWAHAMRLPQYSLKKNDKN